MTDDPRLRWQDDPVACAREAFGVELWAKQAEILEALRDHKKVAVASCHESGKTFDASVAAVATLIAFPDSIVITTAPGGRQVQSLLGAEICDRFAQFRGRYGETVCPAPNTTSWHYDREGRPKWYWVGFSTSADTAQEHATKFVGFHPKAGGRLLLVFDEAGGVPRPIWRAADGLMTSDAAKWLAIGNPTDPTSDFAACWRDPEWHRISISAFDCPNLQPNAKPGGWGVTRSWVESMIRKYGEGSWPVESKVYGRFPTSSSDTLISIGAVQSALGRQPVACAHTPTSLGVGVDVARFGDDATLTIVVCAACRSIVEAVERSGQDTQRTAGETLAVAARRGMYAGIAGRIAIDDTGVGGGVTDRLREEGWRVSAENFGAGPRWERKDGERFVNRRAELWWGLREWMPGANLGTLAADWHDQLFADLTQVRYEYKGDQRIVLESKAELKKRTGKSPDFGDALALAVAATVNVPRFDMAAAVAGVAAGRHDPRDDRDARDRRRSSTGFDPDDFARDRDMLERLR